MEVRKDFTFCERTSVTSQLSKVLISSRKFREVYSLWYVRTPPFSNNLDGLLLSEHTQLSSIVIL